MDLHNAVVIFRFLRTRHATSISPLQSCTTTRVIKGQWHCCICCPTALDLSLLSRRVTLANARSEMQDATRADDQTLLRASLLTDLANYNLERVQAPPTSRIPCQLLLLHMLLEVRGLLPSVSSSVDCGITRVQCTAMQKESQSRSGTVLLTDRRMFLHTDNLCLTRAAPGITSCIYLILTQ